MSKIGAKNRIEMIFASNLGAKEVLHLMKTASKIGAKNLHRDDFCVKIGCKSESKIGAKFSIYDDFCVKIGCKSASKIGAKFNI